MVGGMNRFLGLELDSQGEGDGHVDAKEVKMDNGATVSKKEKRTQKKAKKLVAEYQVSLSNDELKRPGELLDSPHVKKLRIEPSGDKKTLSPEEFKELKKLLTERKKAITQLPRFILQGAGITSSITTTQHDLREPIFMSDVQHLLLYALGGNSMIHPPNRWCTLQKAQRLTHVVALIVEGLTTKDFVLYEHLFPKLTDNFKDRVEIMAPAYYGRDVAQELSCIPLSNAQKEAILKKYGSIEKAISEKEIVKQFRALFPTKTADDSVVAPSLSVKAATELPSSDIFPRTYLLMGLNQMTFEGYPLPFWTQLASRCSGYKLSKPEYKEVSSSSPMFSIDCEMCITETNPSELTRVAVINENNEVVYESYVKPKEKIINYLTQFSGITEEILKDVTTTLEDVQEALIRLLPEDAIWIGQSLNCDLHALKMMHPYVIDTSLIFNLSGIAGRKSKLSHMSSVFLNEEIQTGKGGHCPIEDAKAAMKLVKLKLSQGFLFGDNLNATDDPAIPEGVLATSIFNRAYKSSKTVAVVGPQRVLQEYENVTITPPDGTAFTSFKVSKNKEVINKLTEIATSHQLTIAHVDLSSKLEESDHLKKETLLQKVDKWCDTVYKHVSINGMCVIIFSGPKSVSQTQQQQPLPINNESADDSSSGSGEKSTITSTNSESQPNSSESSSQITPALPNPNQLSKKRKKPRRNGVCFIRINTRQVP